MTDDSAPEANSQTKPTTIKTVDNGPLQIKGAAQLVDHDGNSYDTGKTIFLCRCGESRNKPFCDGSHAKVGFVAGQRAAAAEQAQDA
ncbi:CDGSH iron-sulfur domain-containing protein [Nocardioides sp. NPDC057772]|uniref:CDGSH iron-sulfur domain-containing protein n=1 Tax=unclassified Nocardioides TaxID=2615069 RepID=UPI0002028E0B|nr:CDGSH iron-sulfur domain-containing protein [Nocardioides sp. NBC_00368]EGD42872.1 zinc finger, CDGSH-type protein [Nocardioidaceae bacterium Broad-1]MBC7272912.1 CDGSH iron-sulfur domain-containing protein [Streptomyces sp.]